MSKQQTPETLQADAKALSDTSSRTRNLTQPCCRLSHHEDSAVPSFQAEQPLKTCCWKTYALAASSQLGEGRCLCCLSCNTSRPVCSHQHLHVFLLGQSHHAPKSADLTVQHQGPSSTTSFVIGAPNNLGTAAKTTVFQQLEPLSPGDILNKYSCSKTRVLTTEKQLYLTRQII